MQGGIRIGRIFGINIYLDWSWIFIFLLVTWSLAAGLFPAWHPDWSPMLSWTVATAASLLLFVSILLHELSHSLVAKARGLPVRRITLFLFGGVSNIEREPDSPATEFWMAVVGPITSIALGVFFLLLSGIIAGLTGQMMATPVETVSHLDPLSTLLLWLGPINIFIFIGWFLNGAARQSYRQIVIQDLLEDVPVARLMRNNVPAVSPDLPISSLVYNYIMNTGESAFPVVAGDRIAGLVSLEDVRKVPREAWDKTPVSQIMTRAEQLAAVTPEEDASEALNQLERRDVRQVPVIQNGHLVGLLRRRDIMRWLQTQSEFATS